MKKERYSNFELLRIICMCLIILFHFVWHSNYEAPDLSKTKYFLAFINMFGELGVNCFILITGYFCINSRFKLEKIIKLLSQVLFYSILVYIVYGFVDITPSSWYYILFPNTFSVWWFTSTYILIYLLSPYINKIINNSSEAENTRLLLLLLFLYCFLPTIFGFFINDTEKFPYYNRLIWLIIIYILGAYIRKYNLNLFSNLEKSIKHFCISTMLIALSIVTIDIVFENVSINYFWRPNTILMLYMSVSLFMVFKNLKIKNNIVINKIASTTLGIYLMHDGPLMYLWWNNFFDSTYILSNLRTNFYMLLIVVVIIFITGMIVDFIRQFIFKYTIDKIINKVKRIKTTFLIYKEVFDNE